MTRVIQQYCGNNFSFVEDRKGLAECLIDQKVASDETLISFDVSALFTNIPVPAALEFINGKFPEHITRKEWKTFMNIAASYPTKSLSPFWN